MHTEQFLTHWISKNKECSKLPINLFVVTKQIVKINILFINLTHVRLFIVNKRLISLSKLPDVAPLIIVVEFTKTKRNAI